VTGPTDKSAPAATATDEMARLLATAEPAASRPLGGLIERLAISGRLPPGGAASDPETGELNVRGVVFDSRLVRPGSLFVAVAGAHADGHDFVATSATLGAAAAIVEKHVADAALPQIVVDDTRRALATAAAWWYGDPSRQLGIVGITGTDGKTTTSFLATAILEAAGISAGLITTAAAKVGSLRTANPEHVTTPEAPQLQRMLRAMVAAGNEAAIVETTSHGLALERVAEVAYDVAIFTNLTHEHLELHGTFEAYREAKLSLFRRLGEDATPKRLARSWPRVAIINVDDPAASLFVDAARGAGARIVTYGESGAADVRATAVAEDPRSMRIEVATPRWRGEVELRLAGRFNVHNALAALALGEALELDPAATRAALAAVEGVPGRMERVTCGQPFGVVVDYAHSPASLEKVLDVLAPMASAGGGGLVAVFGSAGERDTGKRPMMGRVAGERCRVVVITNEDPRGEDAAEIIEQIAAGARAAAPNAGRAPAEILEIEDRRAAIEAAFERARPGDVVLLAGKGHEQTIIMAGGPIPWDERSEAIRTLKRLGYGSEGGAMRRSGGR
jgi:UDP-N-acetylmuramoyl-L-alanyl-D-glutamate--2,6-diaminopimelate ligase